MCSHPPLEVGGHAEQLFGFVASWLHDRIRAKLGYFVGEIMQQSRDDLEQIVNDAEFEQHFESPPSEAGPHFAEPAQGPEGALDPDIKDDPRAIIAPIAEAIIENMCSPTALGVAPDQERLFVFIATRLRDQIRRQLVELVTEITEHCAGEVIQIIAEEEEVEPEPPVQLPHGSNYNGLSLAAARCPPNETPTAERSEIEASNRWL
jgi:hypothetical protein